MTEGLAKALGSTLRASPVLGLVERHLLADETPSDRQADCIHPSEAAHENWCPRATYYRISGEKAERSIPNLAMEMVFERGHEDHRKWQNWLWRAGVLVGDFECSACEYRWEATSPTKCPYCKSKALKYREVPVSKPDYLLGGHADGFISGDFDEPIEIKTIGTGTVRIEAPKLLERYTFTYEDNSGAHKGVDWPGLWSGIRRPFASHIRQAMLYMFCEGWPTITFIYDPKFITAYPKEFQIKYEPSVIEEILDTCLLIKSCLEKQRPPKRPMWAEPNVPACKNCPYRKVCYASRPSGSRTRRTRTRTPERANIRTSKIAYEPYRHQR